jgi:hypothetical protein
MYVITHQAIGINGTERLYSNTILIVALCKSLKALYHLKIILIVLEDILTVDTSKHDMIDASTTFCPFLSWHVLMII